MTSKQTDDELFGEELDALLASLPDLRDPSEQGEEAQDDDGLLLLPPNRGRSEDAAEEADDASPPEEPEDEDDEDEFPHKPHPVLRRLLAAFLILTAVLSLTALAADQWLLYHHNRGKAQLSVDYSEAKLRLPETDEPVITYDDGKTVNYNGHTYRLNENLSTVLFMGIDRENIAETDYIGLGGQADVVLLIALDTATGEMNILNIPRDTYAEIVRYALDGTFADYSMHQICLAYAYGDGRESSCLNMRGTVARLLYGMPISKYIAIDMDGVLVANEDVGGVTVTALEDMWLSSGYVQQGQEVTLRGKDCERYIRTRQHEVDSNVARMDRQKQYIRAFAATLIGQAKHDFSAISHLYQDITPYIVSDMDLSDVIYLAQTYLTYGLDFHFVGYEGQYDWLENSRGDFNAVYYPDEDSLFEAVLAIYYQQVD